MTKNIHTLNTVFSSRKQEELLLNFTILVHSPSYCLPSRTHEILSSLNHYEVTEAAIAGIASSNGQTRRSMLQRRGSGVGHRAEKVREFRFSEPDVA